MKKGYRICENLPDQDMPICKRCIHCRFMIKTGRNKYDVICAHNENLGAVGVGYSKCPGFNKD